ncbi:hypothetical protein MCUN1_001188 [Malassezia cuniculi]|uniref:Uncharacterized protein n=1 Tax=Malassezia cuniculi TaxID=948313 RepID=A0AAF0J6B4_9BASI|nr:hypothetical protein MCUN1_001188 [Malassezia cuniculi]
MLLHRALSEREESRLVLFLDNALLKIQRNFQKRREPDAPFAGLPAFLHAWDTPLELVTSVPLIGSSAALRDTYLLRLTSEITDGIIAYSTTTDTHSRDAQLTLVLYWLDLLDRAWAVRMNRETFDIKAARDAAHTAYPWDNDPKALRAAQKAASSSLRVPSSRVSTPHQDAIVSFQQTDRIRLREVLVSARERIFAWMRSQLGGKAPPVLEEHTEESDVVAGVVRQAAAVAEQYAANASSKRKHKDERDDSDQEPDTKRVDAKSPSPPRPAASHYDELFSKKLDPDASDDDGEQDDAPDTTETPVDSLAYWDLHYSTLFSRALRLLHKTTPVSAPDQ